jgi:hypothetical protein
MSLPARPPPRRLRLCVSVSCEEEDTCMSYEEEDTCHTSDGIPPRRRRLCVSVCLSLSLCC